MSLHIWHKNSKFKSIRSRYRKYFGSLNFVEIGLDMGSTLNLPEEERKKLLQRLKAKSTTLKRFKEAKIDAILADFASTNLYEEDFLKDLEEGLKKSSVSQ